MSEAAPQTKQQLSADLMALHRQLEEIASRTKASKPADRPQGSEGPVLVIRGK